MSHHSGKDKDFKRTTNEKPTNCLKYALIFSGLALVGTGFCLCQIINKLSSIELRLNSNCKRLDNHLLEYTYRFDRHLPH